METRLYRIPASYRLTPQTTTGQSPAEMLMNRRPRSRLDLLCPSIQEKVFKKQSDAVDRRGTAGHRVFYEGDAVWALNFAGCHRWVTGVIQQQLGPVSFIVALQDGRTWKRHIDHLRQRWPNVDSQPEESAVLPREPSTPWGTQMPPAARTQVQPPAAQTQVQPPVAQTQVQPPTAQTQVQEPTAQTQVPPVAQTQRQGSPTSHLRRQKPPATHRKIGVLPTEGLVTQSGDRPVGLSGPTPEGTAVEMEGPASPMGDKSNLRRSTRRTAPIRLGY